MRTKRAVSNKKDKWWNKINQSKQASSFRVWEYLEKAQAAWHSARVPENTTVSWKSIVNHGDREGCLSLPKKLMNAHYLGRQRTTFSITRQTHTTEKVKINILVPEDRGTSIAWKILLGETTQLPMKPDKWSVTLFIKLKHLCRLVLYIFTTTTPQKTVATQLWYGESGSTCLWYFNEWHVLFCDMLPFDLYVRLQRGAVKSHRQKPAKNKTPHIDSSW